MRLRALCLLAVVAMLPCTTAAEIFRYNPSSPLRLGGGFDALHPDRSYAQCLQTEYASDKVGLPIDHGPPETVFESSLVKSRRELYEYLHIDAYLSASYGVASGSASFSLDHEYSFSESDTVWVLKATTDYGRYAMVAPTLNERGRALAKNPEEFARQCGTAYVSQERRIASAVALFSLHDMSQSEMNHVKAAASGSYGTFSGGFSFDDLKKAMNDVHQVKVSVYGLGGAGITKLADLAATEKLKCEPTEVCVQSILKAYVAELGAEKATPVEFLTTSWETLGVKVQPPTGLARRRTVMSEMYFEFVDTQTRLQQFGEWIRRSLATVPRSESDLSELKAYQAQYVALDARLKSLEERMASCLLPDAAKCSLAASSEPLPIAPVAEYAEVLSDRDSKGNPIQLVMRYDGAHLQNGQDVDVELQVPQAWRVLAQSQHVTNRAERIEGAGQFTLSDDKQRFGIRRHWNDDETKEEFTLSLGAPQRVCKRYCFGEPR